MLLLVALSEVATAAPLRADAGLFEFDSAWLSEQTASVDPNLVKGAQQLHLDGLSVGSLRLGFDIRKAALVSDQIPSLRYTVADARRDWLQSVNSTGPRRLSLSGSVEKGAVRGLALQYSRYGNGGDDATESRLTFSRAGLSADIRLRNVGEHFARSSLVSDDEWNSLKDMVGWRQSDMQFQWRATSKLSLATEMNRGTKSATGENRDRRRMDLEWKPGQTSRLALYNEINTTGGKTGSTRAAKSGFSWNDVRDGVAWGLAQETIADAGGQKQRTRTLSLATPTDARTSMAYKRTEVKADAGGNVRQELRLHAQPVRTMDLQADLALTSGGKRKKEQGFSLRWKPGKVWNFDGTWRYNSEQRGPAADFHLTGAPDKMTRIDARVQRLQDPANPYARQDTISVERTSGAALKLSVQYASIQTRAGIRANTMEATARADAGFALVSAAWRGGDARVLPGYTDLSLTGKRKSSALQWTARLRDRENADATQTLDLTWKASDRLTVEGAYQRNPEDKNGQPRDLDIQRLTIRCRVARGLQMDIAHRIERGAGSVSRFTDCSLKGKIGEVMTLDVGFALYTSAGGSDAPAYHADVKYDLDADHRIHFAIERETQAVQKRDNLTASMQLVSSF
jgi:hypothetical protein